MKILVIFLSSLLFIACKKNSGQGEVKDDEIAHDFTTIPPAELIATDLNGYISAEDGSLYSSPREVFINPVSNIYSTTPRYLLQGNGSVFTGPITTDKNVTNVYFDYKRVYKSFPVTPSIKNYFRIEVGYIMKLGSGDIEVEKGGTITFDGGVGSIIYPSNSLYIAPESEGWPGQILSNMSASITARSRDIFAEDFALQLPAYLAGDDNGQRWFLMPYATIDLDMQTRFTFSRMEFRYKDGGSLSTPIPVALQNEAPDSLYGWKPTKSGLWEKDSVLRKVGNSYVGRINKATTWMFAKSMKGVYQKIALRTESGATIPKTTIRIKYKSRVIAESMTDADGNAICFVPTNEQLVADILPDLRLRTNIHYEYPIGTSKDGSTKTIKIPESFPYLSVFNGNVFDCNNKPINNGVVKISYNQIYADSGEAYIPIKDGRFSTALWVQGSAFGMASPMTVQITDMSSGNQTIFLNHVFNARFNKNVNFYTCQNPSQLYHNYFIDDKYYEATDNANSSSVFMKGTYSSPSGDYKISTADAKNQGVNFDTWGSNVKDIQINGVNYEYDASQDYNVLLYEVDDDKYIEGSYSIFCKDAAGKMHHIQGDLRLKRVY